MHIRSTLGAILALATIGLIADSALALPLKSKDAVEGQCNESGGTWFAPSEKGVYGCINNDGSGIVCGGWKTEYKNSCESLRRLPGRHGLPTRKELTAEKAKKVETK